MFIEYYECAAGNQRLESNQVKRERKTQHHAQPENQIIAIIDRNKSNIYLTYNKNQSYSVGRLTATNQTYQKIERKTRARRGA